MEIAIAIAVGIVGGLIGAIPFFVARSRVKKRDEKDPLGGIVTGLLATVISFLIMAVEIVLCYVIIRDYLLPFAISAIAVFLLALIVYTATLMRK